MKRNRLILAVAALAAALPYVFWVAKAQEGRGLFAPPPVLPKDEAPLPRRSSQSPARPSASDAAAKPKLEANVVVPAAGFDLPPQPNAGPDIAPLKNLPRSAVIVNGKSDVAPPPMFPGDPAPGAVKKSPEPMPAPIIPPFDASPVAPLATEPAKAAITPSKSVSPAEEPTGPTPKSPLPPLVLPPPVATPAPGSIAPPALIASPGPATIPQPTLDVVAPPPQAKPKAFVPIRPGSGTPLSPPPPLANDHVPGPTTLPPPPVSAPSGALASVQAPSVTVEKRGAASLRGGEAQTYQIIVRNVGPTSAAQVRIEEELPAGVKIVSSDPAADLQGSTAVWTLGALAANREQTVRLVLQSARDAALSHRVAVHVSALGSGTTTTVLRPAPVVGGMAIQIEAPNSVPLGRPVVFKVRVSNQSPRPLTGIVLHGELPGGFSMSVEDGKGGTREERHVEGKVDLTIAPGETKTLDMPAKAVQLGRHTVAVKVTAQGGLEASASAAVDVVSEAALQLQQPPSTRMFLGRDGDLRIDVANHTDKPMRNVAVFDRLPDDLDFVIASDRGLYNGNARTVYWLLEHLPPGKTQTLIVRVHGNRAGQHQNVVHARADGIADVQSGGIVQLEGIAGLDLRVIERDHVVEVGSETVYEIEIANPGNAAAHNVQLQVRFSPGLTPKQAQGQSRFSVTAQGVVFEAIPLLAPQGRAVFRVSATARATGDQRVRFAVSSDQARLPIQREISTRVVPH